MLASLEPAQIEIEEAARALNDYLSRVDLDPARLAVVESRIEALHSAARKLRVAPEALPDELEQRRARLAALTRAAMSTRCARRKPRPRTAIAS